jgi:hypothetical protein
MIFASMLAILQTSVYATPPLSVQWYAGERGDTSKLIQTNKWTFGVTPTQTTKYWVRVTDACGQIDSEAAEITVLRCPNVKITRATATIVAPNKVRLRVLAGGEDRYRWFRSQGPGLPGTQVGLWDDITISFSPGQTFWVRVANGCGNNAVSELLTPTAEAPPMRRRGHGIDPAMAHPRAAVGRHSPADNVSHDPTRERRRRSLVPQSLKVAKIVSPVSLRL